MIVTLSVNIEEFDLPIECGKKIHFDTQLKVSTDGILSILALLEKYDLKATFYTTANYAKNKHDLIKRIVDNGHEIASHDYYHSITAEALPKESKEALEQICGCEIKGYRAPRLATVSSAQLAKVGYKYNSSINPTWIPGRYNNLGKHRKITEEDGLTIYPVSVTS